MVRYQYMRVSTCQEDLFFSELVLLYILLLWSRCYFTYHTNDKSVTKINAFSEHILMHLTV